MAGFDPSSSTSNSGSPVYQIICGGCRNVLEYPRGIPIVDVHCPLCDTRTSVVVGIPCGICRKWMIYNRGTQVVECQQCHSLTYPVEENIREQTRCGRCGMWMTFPYDVPAVRCPACNFVTMCKMSYDTPVPAPQMASSNMQVVRRSPVSQMANDALVPARQMPSSNIRAIQQSSPLQEVPQSSTNVVDEPMRPQQSGNLVAENLLVENPTVIDGSANLAVGQTDTDWVKNLPPLDIDWVKDLPPLDSDFIKNLPSLDIKTDSESDVATDFDV